MVIQVTYGNTVLDAHPGVPLNHPAKTILIVEDDDAIRSALTTALADDYSVLEASNGKKALEVLARINSLSLITLDLMMPEMGGLVFLEHLAKIEYWKTVPVIVISSSIDRTAEEPQVKQWLKKPVDLHIILEAVRMHAR